MRFVHAIRLFFFGKAIRERETNTERQRERKSNIMKFIKNKWYVHTFLIEF